MCIIYMLLFILFSDLVVEVYYREFGKHTKSVNEFSLSPDSLLLYKCVFIYFIYTYILL